MSQENRPIIHVENCTVHVHVSGLASPAQEEALVTVSYTLALSCHFPS